MNSKQVRRFFLKYGIAVAIGGLLSYFTCISHGFWETDDLVERFKILADAFSIPGVVLALTGALVWVGNQQVFAGLTYAGGRMFHALIPFGRTREERETYYDYVTRKREKGGVKGYGFLVHVGIAYFLLSLVFFVLFYVYS
ncbi:MAG: DUF3899 domain-containing protein [Oscillospiraceae bacterium]|nr:DUF3899 domain-containing protein [Oscillospiraceae bacterium]